MNRSPKLTRVFVMRISLVQIVEYQREFKKAFVSLQAVLQLSDDFYGLALSYEPRHKTRGFSTRSETNRALKLQKMARGVRFSRI